MVNSKIIFELFILRYLESHLVNTKDGCASLIYLKSDLFTYDFEMIFTIVLALQRNCF